MYLKNDILKDPATPFFVKIDNILVPFFVEYLNGGTHGDSYIKFKHIDSDKAAGLLINKDLYTLKNLVADALGVDENELGLQADEFIGFSVKDADTGETYGTVKDIEQGVEYDYLVVEKSEDQEDLFIPFIDEFVKEILEDENSQKGEILVTLPEGFLEI